MMNNEMLWNAFLAKIQMRIDNNLSYETWFAETELLSIENGICKVIVPTSVHIRYLSSVYIKIIEEVFNDVFNTNADFAFIAKDDYKNDFNSINSEADTFNKSDDTRNYHSSNLKAEYTFDNFVVGNSNRVAYSVAFAVAEQPGKLYNPLFIYGKSGLGKTHLMQAVGNYILENSRERVLYVSANTFLEDFVDGVKNDDSNSFKRKYRDVDVLIIDDIQFLSSAERTREQFFHTFNLFHHANKQIIISSDRSPDDLKTLEDRLRTRFNWGSSVNINPPELELRIQILKKKLALLDVPTLIDESVIDYIAQKATNDVRELEGTLRNLLATASILGNGVTIDYDFAIECLKDSSTVKKSKRNDVNNIINVIATTYNVSADEIIGKSRKSEIVFPRQIAMYIARDITELSYEKIGLYFGNRNHSTVVSSFEKISKMMKKDENFAKTIINLKEKM